jgi:hypothetical protein
MARNTARKSKRGGTKKKMRGGSTPTSNNRPQLTIRNPERGIWGVPKIITNTIDDIFKSCRGRRCTGRNKRNNGNNSNV